MNMDTTLVSSSTNPYNGFGKESPTQIKTYAQTAAAVAFVGMFVSGTGTALSYDNYNNLQALRSRLPSFIEILPAATALDVRSPSEHLANIINILNIPISDLADIFSVSRQMIYKWRDGSMPEDDKQKRIAALSLVADQFYTAKIDRPDTLLKMRAFHGQSFLMLFKQGKDESRHVAELIKEAKIRESAIVNSKLRKHSSPPHQDWQSTDVIPGSISES
jgi:hypothetical protein